MHEEYVKGRNAYNYPSIGLCACETLKCPDGWGKSFKKHEFKTTLDLDIHHYTHLHSEDDQEVILGIYSVMYWGYITSGAKSITRCNWISVGNANNAEASLTYLGLDFAVGIIRSCINLLQHSKYGDALTEIRNLPHVGVSFGTKYLAFLDPENVGVLDDKITRHLSAGSYEHLLGKETIKLLEKPKNETLSEAADRFEAFCKALNVIKKEINETKKQWKDISGSEMCRFRSVDVERALFSIAQEADNI